MALQIQLGQYKQAMDSFKVAVDTFEKAIKLAPKQGESQNRIGSANLEIAWMYMKKNERGLAVQHLEESIKIFKELEKKSNYIYVANSLGKTYERYAEVCHQF